MAVEQSPISAPRPELGPQSLEPGPLVEREIWGYVFWGLLGVAVAIPELLAAIGTNMPFFTISTTSAKLAAHYNWVSMIYLGGLVVLGTRILFYPWPYKKAER
jgi:hypothetical protein